MTLVSGTATLNFRPVFAGEWFILRTPTGRLSGHYPNKDYVRVNSYLDALTLTPQEKDTEIQVGATLEKDIKGQTMIYERDGRFVPAVAGDLDRFAEWDKWTAERIAERDAEMSVAMKDAGVTSPIPGLIEMKDQGKFFSCAPYGTCSGTVRRLGRAGVSAGQAWHAAGVRCCSTTASTTHSISPGSSEWRVGPGSSH